MRGDEIAEPRFQIDSRGRMLGGSDQAQVPVRKQVLSRKIGDDPQHRDSAIRLQRLPNHPMCLGPLTWLRITPAMITPRVQFLTAKYARRYGPGRLGGVDHQNDGGLERLGQFDGAVRALRVCAIVEPAVSFDEVESFRAGVAVNDRPRRGIRTRKNPGCAPDDRSTRSSMRRRIIRSFLKRPHGKPARRAASNSARDTMVLPASPERPPITSRGKGALDMEINRLLTRAVQ